MLETIDPDPKIPEENWFNSAYTSYDVQYAQLANDMLEMVNVDIYAAE